MVFEDLGDPSANAGQLLIINRPMIFRTICGPKHSLIGPDRQGLAFNLWPKTGPNRARNTANKKFDLLVSLGF